MGSIAGVIGSKDGGLLRGPLIPPAGIRRTIALDSPSSPLTRVGVKPDPHRGILTCRTDG